MKKTFIISLLFFWAVFFSYAVTSNIITGFKVKGLEKVPLRLIKEVVTLKVGDKLDEEKIQRNVNNIYLLGYFADVSAELEDYKGGKRVVFEVVENETVKKIVFVGNKLFSSQQLKKIMKTKEGSVFNIPVLNKDLKAITEFYNKKGYVFSGVINMETRDLGQYIKIYINEVKVGKISVKGNTKTRDYVILREVSLKPGDYFSSIELMRSMRRLMNLGFFSKVKPDYKFDKSDRSKINLTIEVKEQKTGSASFGGGYSSANGLVGFLEVKQKNFRGKGQSVAVKLEYGGVKTYQVSFFDPYFFGKTSFGISVYKTKVRRDYYSSNILQATYDEERHGEYLTFGRRTGRTTTTSLKFVNENVKVTPVYNPANVIEKKNEDRQTLVLSVVKDTRDNVFKPAAGRKDSVSASFTGGFLKGKDSYQKYRVTFQRYGRLNRRIRTAARLMFGFVNLTDGDLPVYEEFGVGGTYTLRGYYTREFTGDHMVLGNFELRYDINDKFTAVCFLDTGDAWGREGNDDMDLKKAAGFGIMFNSPMGPIRIDWAKPISDNGRDSRTSFSMGSMF